MEGFSPQCKDLCELAKDRWVEICANITTGDCTKLDLDTILEKHEQMMQLTTAIETPDINAMSVEQQIKLKLNDYAAFVSFCEKFVHICTLLPESVDGMSFSNMKRIIY